jgi:hypothetical protein
MEQPNVSKTSSTKFDSIKIHSDAATVGEDKEWQKYDPSLTLHFHLKRFKFADFSSPLSSESFRQSPLIGSVEARHYMSSCTQHGVGPEPCKRAI